MQTITVFFADGTKQIFKQRGRNYPKCTFEGNFISVRDVDSIVTSWPITLILRVEQVEESRW